jgi:hypothetical protein
MPWGVIIWATLLFAAIVAMILFGYAKTGGIDDDVEL